MGAAAAKVHKIRKAFAKGAAAAKVYEIRCPVWRSRGEDRNETLDGAGLAVVPPLVVRGGLHPGHQLAVDDGDFHAPIVRTRAPVVEAPEAVPTPVQALEREPAVRILQEVVEPRVDVILPRHGPGTAVCRHTRWGVPAASGDGHAGGAVQRRRLPRLRVSLLGRGCVLLASALVAGGVRATTDSSRLGRWCLVLGHVVPLLLLSGEGNAALLCRLHCHLRRCLLLRGGSLRLLPRHAFHLELLRESRGFCAGGFRVFEVPPFAFARVLHIFPELRDPLLLKLQGPSQRFDLALQAVLSRPSATVGLERGLVLRVALLRDIARCCRCSRHMAAGAHQRRGPTMRVPHDAGRNLRSPRVVQVRRRVCVAAEPPKRERLRPGMGLRLRVHLPGLWRRRNPCMLRAAGASVGQAAMRSLRGHRHGHERRRVRRRVPCRADWRVVGVRRRRRTPDRDAAAVGHRLNCLRQTGRGRCRAPEKTS
mmetsp:Transcript_106225/g.298712  ORF Transcript_106225/g.298712 Transcript_106225/m.298712 type:complete len:479 (+) Transcript_106225:53-1489(+)